jgi:hypothetical protein
VNLGSWLHDGEEVIHDSFSHGIANIGFLTLLADRLSGLQPFVETGMLRKLAQLLIFSN